MVNHAPAMTPLNSAPSILRQQKTCSFLPQCCITCTASQWQFNAMFLCADHFNGNLIFCCCYPSDQQTVGRVSSNRTLSSISPSEIQSSSFLPKFWRSRVRCLSIAEPNIAIGSDPAGQPMAAREGRLVFSPTWKFCRK